MKLKLEISKLKEQQKKEFDSLKESQQNSDNSDDKTENDRIYQAIPRAIAEKLKAGANINSIGLQNLTFVSAEITNLNSIRYYKIN